MPEAKRKPMTREDFFKRARWGQMLVIYEDELPDLEALAGPWPDDPTTTYSCIVQAVTVQEVSKARAPHHQYAAFTVHIRKREPW